MSGRNAKTNFPVEQTIDSPNENKNHLSRHSSSSNMTLSEILHAKLKKCTKALSPSLTCLRLDTEKCNIGVWQKRAGSGSNNANWVMTVELGEKTAGYGGVSVNKGSMGVGFGMEWKLLSIST
ncbi:hypothetical protein QQ045_000266 [Rhodiola kirilowii]